MRPLFNRQLWARLGAGIFSALATLCAEKSVDPDPRVAQELQIARAQCAALSRRAAEPVEWEAVEKTFADLAARHPREPSVHGGYAEFLWERNQFDRAVREWEEAERLDPKNAAVLARLAEAHLAGGRGKIAAQYLDRACAAAPEEARLRHAAGTTLFLFRHELVDATRTEAQVLGDALAHLAAAARLAPGDVEYARAYAETFYGLPKPDWEAARAAWEHYREVSPNRDFAHLNLARVHLKLGQTDTALGYLKRIQNADFEDVKAKIRQQIEAVSKAPPAP